MERKTKIHAEDGRQEITITREFELPLELLFRAYTDPAIVEQWMGNKVLQLDNQALGAYRFETSDPKGNVVLRSRGTIHSFEPDRRITRTFEMENTPFEAQLEFLEFAALTESTSLLTMHVIYRSVAQRDQMLQLPFAQGINMAHTRLEQIMHTLQSTDHEQN